MPQASSQPIDWWLLGKAQDFYQRRGYQYVEVPWAVRPEITQVTIPHWVDPFSLTDLDLDLVGSAEQSFLQMMWDGRLLPGRYCAISPCFRREPHLDDLHQLHFMKLELIDFNPPDLDQAFLDIVGDAHRFMGSYMQVKLRQIEDDESGPRRQYDLESLGGIELGSYGVRNAGRTYWVYGTGIAEPRFSYVLKKQGRSV